jgi:hypothetical protein
MGDVQHGVILDAATRTDADAVHVAANHGVRPNGTIVAQLYIADHASHGVDVDACAQLRGLTLMWAEAVAHADS